MQEPYTAAIYDIIHFTNRIAFLFVSAGSNGWKPENEVIRMKLGKNVPYNM